jgi:hypothetical protein
MAFCARVVERNKVIIAGAVPTGNKRPMGQPFAFPSYTFNAIGGGGASVYAAAGLLWGAATFYIANPTAKRQVVDLIISTITVCSVQLMELDSYAVVDLFSIPYVQNPTSLTITASVLTGGGLDTVDVGAAFWPGYGIPEIGDSNG